MSEPRLLKVTPEQLQKGWMELRGITPVHHEFQVMSCQKDGSYIVVNPRWIVEQKKAQRP